MYAYLEVDPEEGTPQDAIERFLGANASVFRDAVSRLVHLNEPLSLILPALIGQGPARLTRIEAQLLRDAQGAPRLICGEVTDEYSALEPGHREGLESQLLQTAGELAGVYGWMVDAATRKISFMTELESVLPEWQGVPLPVEVALGKLEPASAARARAALEACLDRGERIDLEIQVLDVDGKLRWIRLLGTLERLSDGLPLRAVGAMQDISAYRETERALKTSEERFRLLSNATADAIWDLDLIADELWWGGGFEQMLGVQLEELSPRFSNWAERIHPEDSARVLSTVRDALAAQTSEYTHEYRLRREDGSYVHVEDRGRVERNHLGQAIRVVGGITDISDRKLFESELREQAQLLEAAREAMLVLDLQGKVTRCNASARALLQLENKDPTSTDATRLLAHGDTSMEEIRDAVVCKGEWRGEFALQHGSDELLVESLWSVIADEHGQPSALLCILVDVTDKRRLEQDILRSQRLESIGTLASGIAHDLNNTLAPVLITTSMLLEDETPMATRREIELIHTCTNRGATILRNLLNLSRGESGQRSRTDLRDVILEVESILAKTLPPEILLHVDIPPRLPSVRADATQIHQALLNLALNARDAMPQGGPLKIVVDTLDMPDASMRKSGVHGVGEWISVEITDKGVGIEPHLMERLFEPFFTTKPHGVGHGLGLYTVHMITEAHGGHVRVKSRPGKGTSFFLYFPADQRGDSTTTSSFPGAATTGSKTHRAVLVVDDEPLVLEATASVLALNGYNIRTANDGQEALDLLEMAPKDVAVVLTDMSMPNCDGARLIETVTKQWSRIVCIGSSGLGHREHRKTALDAGAAGFLSKPYTSQELLASVERAMHRYRQRTRDERLASAERLAPDDASTNET